MPAFTLYGGRGSTNTDRVRLTLAEGGFTDYKLVLINLQKGEQKSPEHKALHPFGKIPVLVSDEEKLTLYESRSISKYLCQKYNFPLIPSPSNITANALFSQAENVEMLYFSIPAGTIAFELFAKKFFGLPVDEEAVEGAKKALENFFDIAEGMLQGGKYMAGEEFGLIDIYYIPLIKRLFVCGFGDLIEKRENVRGWWERCVNRPAIKGMLDADAEAAAAARRG